MASNMDGVGTVEMARALQKRELFTCLIKVIQKHITDVMSELNPDFFAPIDRHLKRRF